jgi:hypothetical protein
MEKAVEIARTFASNGKILLAQAARILAEMCGELAALYQQAGRREDALILAREANSLS